MRTLAALAVIAMVAICTTAQDERTVSVASYGRPSGTVVSEAAETAGLELSTRGFEWDEDEVCFLVADGVTPGVMAALLSFATGVPMRVEGGMLIAGEINGGTVKGYDVSVLAGAYVEYVNNYGAPKQTNPVGESDLDERTAAEHLSEAIEYILHHPQRAELLPSVVGDRILLTLSAEDHARVREFMDLLMSEHGGESGALKDERAVREKLANAKYSGDLSATPVSSVVLGICKAGGVDAVLGAGIANAGGDWHIDFVVKEEVSVLEALNRLMRQLEGDDFFLTMSSINGAAAVEITDLHVWSGYRVYDIGGLLKKLHASYQRQRTAPGKDGGFEGDLKAAGGNEVVKNAIYDQLEIQGHEARIEAFGTKIVVRGGAEAVDAATTILQEMGWEPPKE